MIFTLVVATLYAGSPGAGEHPAGDADYCSIETAGATIEVVRPSDDEPPIDDVNWFARPVPNQKNHWIIAFASGHQNYLYDLTTGQRVRIPDESDAVATPDGRYITVPSNYTPDDYIRFYDAPPLLDALERGADAHDQPPAYIHVHPDLRKVYYQSTGIVSTSRDGASETTVYRLMFSGTRDEAGFRIVDYRFVRDLSSGKLDVTPSAPMKLCPEIPNDMATPFISKDGRYVAAYSSSSAEREYSPGSSLKIFRITRVLPESATTSCEPVLDFGFAAGKADFAYDNSALTFHISQGGYLTPFVNGGLEPPTITDVVLVKLTRNDRGDITGYSDMARVTTSLREGVGSYFPAFLPDGKVFYIFNHLPKTSDGEKRFSFKVVDPERELTMANVFAEPRKRELAASLGRIWHLACRTGAGKPLSEHEAPWVLASLSRKSCEALVSERWTKESPPRAELEALCALRP